MRTILSHAIVLLFISFLSSVATPAFSASDEEVAAAIKGGQTFLVAGQEDSGAWYDSCQGDNLAVTCAAVAALIESGAKDEVVPGSSQAIEDGATYIQQFVQPDGGVYQNSDYPTYENGSCLLALAFYAGWKGTDTLNTILTNAVEYSKTCQVRQDVEETNPYYGGFNYDCADPGGQRADLSNTQFGLMGLYYGSQQLKLPVAGEAWATAALKYLGRSSGWNNPDAGETWNDQSWAEGKNVLGTDGAFSYVTTEEAYPGGSMTGAGIWGCFMIKQDLHPMADKAVQWFFDPNNYLWSGNPGYDDGSAAYHYFIYAMAKGLAGVVGGKNADGTDKAWFKDMKDELVDHKMKTVDGSEPLQHYWEGGCDRDGGDAMATSWILMAFALSGEGQTNQLPLPQPPDGDNPVKGAVTLVAQDGVTISNGSRGDIGQALKQAQVGLPVGPLSFTLLNVPVGGTAKLTIDVPQGAFDPNDAASFVNPDGTLKAGLAWFKIENGAWKGLPQVPITVDKASAQLIVTLQDGGPEDQDREANGQIEDPGAPGYGYGPEPQPTPTSDSGGCGCSVFGNDGDKPRLLQPLLGGLLYLLPWAAILVLRRRNRIVEEG